MSRCERYRADGSPCDNETEHADGWCRQPECPGFQRSSPDTAPEGVGKSRGTRRQIRESQRVDLRGLTIADVPDIRITTRALDSFLFHHGGDARLAELQLRAMLEDFLLRSARSVQKKGYVTLAREGFVLTLSPQVDAVVGYHTVHRERTWEQVKAGVSSRLSRTRRMTPKDRPPILPPGPPVAAEDFVNAVDPATIRLTTRVRTSFVKLESLPNQQWDESLDALIRKAFDSVVTGLVAQRGDGLFKVTAEGREWLVSEDAQTLIGVRRAV